MNLRKKMPDEPAAHSIDTGLFPRTKCLEKGLDTDSPTTNVGSRGGDSADPGHTLSTA
jgi:hypothetical protein